MGHDPTSLQCCPYYVPVMYDTHVSLAYKRVHQLGFSRQRLSKIIVNHKAFQLEGHGEKKQVVGQSQAYQMYEVGRVKQDWQIEIPDEA